MPRPLAVMASAPAEQFVEQPEIEAAAVALIAALGGGAGTGFVAAARRLRLDLSRWREPAAVVEPRQCRGRDALMSGPHEPAPDFHRQAAADRLLGRRIVVVAEPDAGDEARGVADEPRVAEILAGAGLAGSEPARQVGAARGAAGERLAHHRIHHADSARIDDTAERLRRARIKRLAVSAADALDDMRRHGETAVGKRSVGGYQLDDGDFRGAERDRGIGFEF